ncbi:cobyrinate a,c-diamide synthase [Maricurvus nonylphenolicus]|uniref:cobyrinate a,c-diamide synthase n=1 Tax=Maricurvus nonylphenolicus TaxID=1008307 RepID=UPI0036F3CEFD
MSALPSTSCPALFIAAPSSGQGKTTVTAAMARLFSRQGKVVRVFKTGPDYLDPQILEQASGNPVEQLDMWMAGETYCQQKLFDAAQVADLILVEGAMGLFDGEPSSADLAARFNIPVALLMDVKGMAQTAAAIATGLANFRDDFRVAGLLANNCGSERHAQLIRDALPENLPLLAVLKRDPAVALPERHLGLVQASEVRDELEIRLDTAADWLQASGLAIDSEALLHQVEFKAPGVEPVTVEPVLANKTIALASDEAFSFIYDANIKQLQALGAKVTRFSPLHDKELPQADGLWLPGGYPELHAQQLSANTDMLKSIQAFYQQGKPILAECGGFLYCLETLTDLDESQYPMLGLLEGHGAMRGKRGCQGMQTAPLPEGEIRAHAHHRSRSFDTAEPIAYGRRQRHPAPGEAIYRQGHLTASYLHLFFPSNPEAIGSLFSGQEIVHV